MPQCNAYQLAWASNSGDKYHKVRMRLGFKVVSRLNTLFTHFSLPTVPSSLPHFPRSLPIVSKNFTFSGLASHSLHWKYKSSIFIFEKSYLFYLFIDGFAQICLLWLFAGKNKLSLWTQRAGYKTETQLSDMMQSGKEIQVLNRNLYPAIEPYSTGFLKVSDVHTIYWEQSGNPNGHVSIHGLYPLSS